MSDMVKLKVGDKAPDATVQGKAGGTIRLSALWQDGPVALVFMRHFG
jgi:peroxiredoxin